MITTKNKKITTNVTINIIMRIFEKMLKRIPLYSLITKKRCFSRKFKIVFRHIGPKYVYLGRE